MSQFESFGWDVYIAVATLVSIVACGVFLWYQARQRVAVGGTTGHVWDEDLGEYSNPLPRWWMWLFYLTVVFSLVYLALYPGLGSFGGQLGWTQVGQLKQENERAEAKFGPMYEKFAKESVENLEKNPEALAIGQKLFLNNCAQCHASDGGGSRGFPNLTDKDWLYGGTPEAIKTTITAGRNGVMPPLGAALGESGAKDVAHYVLSLSGQASDSIRSARGEALFKQNCAACHGADGKGNQQIGAPNLTDNVWLHGRGEAAIIETVNAGRNNAMPAHENFLTPAKIHLLTAYVRSLAK